MLAIRKTPYLSVERPAMNLIFLTLTALLILVNLVGVGLALQRLSPSYALAKPVGIAGLCLLLFFVEHFAGLGRLSWLWPITTAAAIYLCWRERNALREHWRTELVFVLAFGYGFAWRYMFPNIDPSSEHVTDLYFIVNYLPGEQLPPLDHWLPPYRFNIYYAFQHYAAALLGRIFGLDSGTTYNFAFCVIVGLIISTSWLAICQFCQRRSARLLVLFAFVMGGTGVSPILYALIENPKPTLEQQAQIDANATTPWKKIGNVIGAPLGPKVTLWSSVRFIGSSDTNINTELGRKLFPPFDPAKKPKGFVPLDLPQETFSYLVFLGDYHPPLGSFFLLALALACIGLLERKPEDHFAQGVLALTVPLTVITNTWIFPLQAILVMGWIAYRYWRKSPPDWKTLLISGMAGFVLIYPFLSYFTSNGLSPKMVMVAPFEHTPWRHFIVLHWPMITLLLLSLLQRSTRKLVLTLFLVWGLMFVASEMIYVDDIYGGQFQRFNTVLKWWAWIYAGVLITISAINMGGDSRVARYGTVIVIVLIGFYAVDLTRFCFFAPKPHIGRFQGHDWFTMDPTNKAMLNYLRCAEAGIVLDRNDKGSYAKSSTFAMFSDKPALLGWADHECMWRGSLNHVRILGDQVTAFYAGKKQDSLEWLIHNNVRYIVWGADEYANAPTALQSIQSQIGDYYFWNEFYRVGDYRVGMWVRQNQN